MNTVQLVKFLEDLDPRSAEHRGRLRFELDKVKAQPGARPPALTALLERLVAWAESLPVDPAPTPPPDPFDVTVAVSFDPDMPSVYRPATDHDPQAAPTNFGMGGPRPESGWSEADRRLVDHLAGVERMNEGERRRLAELRLSADNRSDKLLIERLLGPVRAEHERALRVHEAQSAQWAERRPSAVRAFDGFAKAAVAERLEVDQPELDQPTREWRAGVLLQNHGVMPESWAS